MRSAEIREAKSAIALLDNIARSNVKRLYFINFIFDSEAILSLKKSLAEAKLEILGLGINGFEEIGEEAWAHWGKHLRSAKNLKKNLL